VSIGIILQEMIVGRRIRLKNSVTGRIGRNSPPIKNAENDGFTGHGHFEDILE
jgi:hypothetical protein